jgi:hypothetical protein
VTSLLADAEHQRLARALSESGRRQFSQTEFWDLFRANCPGLASRIDERRALAECLRAFAEAGLIVLPTAMNWDRTLNPPLPRTVGLVDSRPRVPDPPRAWSPRMAFAASLRHSASRSAAIRIDEWMKRESALDLVPVRERSLEIFGDEKKLDELIRGEVLFGGRLSLNDLRAYQPAPPLAHTANAGASGSPLLILENLHSYESFRQWNLGEGAFSAVVYGAGNAFPATVRGLTDIARSCAASVALYLGDLDPKGLAIIAAARHRTEVVIQPHWNLYRWLIASGTRTPMSDAHRADGAEGELQSWPIGLAASLRELWAEGQRIPQESLGTRQLREWRAYWCSSESRGGHSVDTNSCGTK